MYIFRHFIYLLAGVPASPGQDTKRLSAGHAFFPILQKCNPQKNVYSPTGDRRKTPVFPDFTPDENYDPQGIPDGRSGGGLARNTSKKITPGNDRHGAGIPGVFNGVSGIGAQIAAIFWYDRFNRVFFAPPDREGRKTGLYRACFELPKYPTSHTSQWGSYPGS